MTENLKKFLEAASGDAELAEKVSKAKSGEEIAELAKTLGFTLTEEDFKAPEGEISEEELDGVAGGFRDPITICACIQGAGGGGTGIPACRSVIMGGSTEEFPVIKPLMGCDCDLGGGGAGQGLRFEDLPWSPCSCIEGGAGGK